MSAGAVLAGHADAFAVLGLVLVEVIVLYVGYGLVAAGAEELLDRFAG